METSRVLHEPKLETLERIGEGAQRLDLAGMYDSYAAPLYRFLVTLLSDCLLYTSPSPRDQRGSRMPSSA